MHAYRKANLCISLSIYIIYIYYIYTHIHEEKDCWHSIFYAIIGNFVSYYINSKKKICQKYYFYLLKIILQNLQKK